MSAGAQPVPVSWSPAPAQLAMAYSVCRGITRTNARNFYYAFLVLPKRKRQALSAVYAFMRRCDDIADDPGVAPNERRSRLDTWLDALHRAQQGEPSDDPILLALTDAQRRYTIPAGLLDDLALGTAMDVVDSVVDPVAPSAEIVDPRLTVQYKTFEDLRLYCYRVASVVGLVCIHIFGYRDPAAESLAEQCGLAFQLTNIIRDVKEDAAMGRVYLPEEDLAKFSASQPRNYSPRQTPSAFVLCSFSRPIVLAKATKLGTNSCPTFPRTVSPRSSSWSTSTANFWKKLPSANTTSSTAKSPSP